jgi:hypothetical protein
MFRVVSYQAVLRILFVSLGLLISGAVAQDQANQKPANDAASSAPAQPAAA